MSLAIVRNSVGGVLLGAVLVSLVGCSHAVKDSDKATYFDSAYDDHNRAPANFAPLTVGGEAPQVDELHSRTQADFYFSMGEAQSLAGDHQKAIESFKMVLIYDNTSGQVALRISAEYLKLGLIHKAVEQAELALQKNPGLTDARLMLGGLYSALKSYDKAIAQYQEVLHRDPKNTDAPLYLGAVYAEMKDYPQAIRFFESLAHNENNPHPHLAYYYIGRARAAQPQDKFKKAAEVAFRKALTLKPDHVDSVLGLGQLFTDWGQTEKLVKLYRDFQNEHGPSLRIAEALGPVYLEQEKYDEAMEQFQILEANSDDVLNVQVKMALILIEQKKYQKAADKLQEVLAQAPDSDKIRFYLAAVYEEMKDPSHAVEHFTKVPSESEFYGEAIVHAAYLLKQMKHEDDAEKLAQKALKARTDLPQLYAVYASILDEKGQFQTAKDILSQGVEKFPEQAQLRFFLGTIADRMGDKKAVIDHMKTVIKIDPNHVQGLNYLAYTYSEMGLDLEEAEKLAKRALAIEPKDAYVLDTYGWVLFKKGDTEASIKVLETAFRAQPTESVILEHLGDAYFKADMVDRARSMYERAIEFEGDIKKAQTIRSKISSLQNPSVPKTRMPASTIDASGH